jgi:hypothetical protein
MSIAIPTGKVTKSTANPAVLIIAGFHKSGKTTALAALDDNLIIDVEKGTRFLDAMKVEVNGIKDYSETIAALRSGGKRYKFITIDTGTKLEEVAQELALINYKKSPIGKRFEGAPRDIQNLANGLGYGLIRAAYIDLLDWIKPFCDTLIIVCHIKNSSLTKDGEEVSMVDISLTGQLKTIIAAQSDAVGILYRKKNQSILSFKGGESFLVEARPDHLRGKEFVILESDDNNVAVANWSQVFI